MGAADTESEGEYAARERASEPGYDPLIGTIVNGKYRVESTLARGGMGRIYYAIQVPLERPVALKVVQGDGDNEHQSQFLKRFLQEASILAKLQHPNVVTLFDYGTIEGSVVEQSFIAMEFLGGETLASRMKARGHLSPAETLTLARQTIRGLREAHKHGIIHRDLKPSNIMIVPEADAAEIVKLVDFGIGKVLGRPDDAQDLTCDGVFVGTPRYMAPEQFEGLAGPASDLYALGTILFQALTGRLPFRGSNMSDFMVAKLARETPTLRDVAPNIDVPASVEMLVYHMLARRPEDRPTIEAVSRQLTICEDDVFGPHVATGTGSSPVARPIPSDFYSERNSSTHNTSRPSTAIWSAPPSGSGSMTPYPVPSFGSGGTWRPPTMDRVAPTYPSVGTLTPRPMSSSAHPPPPPPSRAPHVLGLLLGAVGLLAGGAAIALKWRHEPIAVVAPPPSGRSAATDTFTLTIESAPPEAIVSENNVVLGATPLEVRIDRASVVATPRTFTVSRDGFAPTLIVQGPATEDARSMASLAPLAPAPSADVKSRPTTAGRTGAGAPVVPAVRVAPVAVPTPTPGTDIRLKR